MADLKTSSEKFGSIARVPTVPGYIYSGGRTDPDNIPFFEQQFLKSVSRYEDAIAEDPALMELGKQIGYAFFHALRHQWETFSKPERFPETDSLGDKGFDWKFLKGSINSDSVVYGFGVGTNITFEQELAKQANVTVHCFDPTPQAIGHAEKIADQDARISFHPIGIYSKNATIEFFIPTEEGIGSLSATNLMYSDKSIKAKVKKLSSIMKSLGHSHVDLLKIDIEGAEHTVIDNILTSGMRPGQLCVEFDMPVPPWTIEATMRNLFLADYTMVETWGLNCLFVQNSLLEQ